MTVLTTFLVYSDINQMQSLVLSYLCVIVRVLDYTGDQYISEVRNEDTETNLLTQVLLEQQHSQGSHWIWGPLATIAKKVCGMFTDDDHHDDKDDIPSLLYYNV